MIRALSTTRFRFIAIASFLAWISAIIWEAPSAHAQSEDEPKPRLGPRQSEPVTKMPLAVQEAETIDPGALERISFHEDLVWRVFTGFHGMFSSSQGRPLIYPDLGARWRDDGVYLDLHLPALFGLLDAGQFFLRRDVLDTPSPSNLFQSVNEPRHWVYAEIAHLRLGVSTAYTLFEDDDEGDTVPLRLSLGGVGFANWAVLEAAGLAEALENGDAINELIESDPLIIGLGGFVAVGGVSGRAGWDVALELGRDMVEWDSYVPSTGWVIALDGDVGVEIFENFGMGIRARWAVLTHRDDRLVYVMNVSTGALFRF